MRGRRTTLPPGTILNGFTVADLPSTYRGTNRLIQVRCNTCGTLRQCWTSALRNDAVKCTFCGKKDTKQLQRLALDLPRIAVYPDRLVVLTGDEAAPPDCRLFKFVLPDLALPHTDTPQEDDKVPEPDEGWFYHLKVPAQWLDYYCEISDLSDDQADRANAYFDEHVACASPTTFSKCSKSSGTTWVEGGKRYAYLYWRDHNTWLRNGPVPVVAKPPSYSLPKFPPVFHDWNAARAPESDSGATPSTSEESP